MYRTRLDKEHLEEEAQKFFEHLGARANVGPKGEWDLEITFPRPFIKHARHGSVPFRINTQLIVEVKSKESHGASRNMCRELTDWVDTIWQRATPPPAQSIATLRRAIIQTQEDLHAALRNAEELEELKSALRRSPTSRVSPFHALNAAAERTIQALTSRPKGLLIINHMTQKPESERAESPFPDDVMRWASDRGLALTSWLDLLEIERAIKQGTLDSFNFFCALIETRGVLKLPVTYKWEDFCDSYMQLIFHENPDHVFPVERPAFLEEFLPG